MGFQSKCVISKQVKAKQDKYSGGREKGQDSITTVIFTCL